MTEKTVDARGKLCPAPLIMTKQALGEIGMGETLRILIDNEISKNNVERFLADNGFVSTCTTESGVFTVTVAKSKEELGKVDVQTYCTPAAAKAAGHVMVIAADTMGTGSEELGGILMKAFINTIKEVKPLPSSIIFYNSGIMLTVEGSPLIATLKELESLGVSILVCGTCVNYYDKKDLVRVGIVSNMYTILETLTAAQTVIKP